MAEEPTTVRRAGGRLEFIGTLMILVGFPACSFAETSAINTGGGLLAGLGLVVFLAGRFQ